MHNNKYMMASLLHLLVWNLLFDSGNIFALRIIPSKFLNRLHFPHYATKQSIKHGKFKKNCVLMMREEITDNHDREMENDDLHGEHEYDDDATYENAKYVDRESILHGNPRIPPEFDPNPSLWQLQWCQHAHIAPKTSFDREQNVFLTLKNVSLLQQYRISPESLTYENIVTTFSKLHANLQVASLFIRANIDQIPPSLFMKAITREKLNVQYFNNTEEMEKLFSLRDRYVLASNHACFPALIEISKAITRVSTYLTHVSELGHIAIHWDFVEISLFFMTLVNMRLYSDYEVLLGMAKMEANAFKVSEEFLVMFPLKERKQYVQEHLVLPTIAAEMYLNATRFIAQKLPRVYAKVVPEIALMHETYFINDPIAIKRFTEDVFCSQHNVSILTLYQQLAALEGMLQAPMIVFQYQALFHRVSRLRAILATPLSLLQRLQANHVSSLTKAKQKHETFLWGGTCPLSIPEFAWYHKHANHRTLFVPYRTEKIYPLLLVMAIVQGNIFESISIAWHMFRNRSMALFDYEENRKWPLVKDLPGGEKWMLRDKTYTQPHPNTELQAKHAFVQMYLRFHAERMDNIEYLEDENAKLSAKNMLSKQAQQANEILPVLWQEMRKEAALLGLDGYNVTKEEIALAAKEDLQKQRRLNRKNYKFRDDLKAMLEWRDQMVEMGWGKKYLSHDELERRDLLEKDIQKRKRNKATRDIMRKERIAAGLSTEDLDDEEQNEEFEALAALEDIVNDVESQMEEQMQTLRNSASVGSMPTTFRQNIQTEEKEEETEEDAWLEKLLDSIDY